MGSHDHDALPDAVLELVLLRLDSPLWLLRASLTCRHWRRIIASDAFLARHGAPPVIAGSYYNQGGSARPSFELSLSFAAAALDCRHFTLDFVPGGDGKSSWTVIPSLTPPPSPSVSYWSATAVLLDGGGGGGSYSEESGGIVGMCNFRVLFLVEDDGNDIRACMFTSGSSSWREMSIVTPRAPHLVGVAAGQRY
ncbi:hypothetical protein C2845_PM03G21790 [Panicum miliaceum]|uniref:F-box domain-containing protein n=1 Tax=Panicum miliaceum TaxID=4540 RepID=A0A3L6T6R5_PANMI|nr:hypothetical protein C2845_PM03G21790 [Panicum miliaceum]